MKFSFKKSKLVLLRTQINKQKTKIVIGILALILALPSVIIPSAISALNPIFIKNEVKNVSQDTAYRQTVRAMPGEEVAFSIYLKNNTSQTLTNVYLKQTINPYYLTYKSGTSQLIVGNRATKLADGIMGSGVKIGDLEPTRAVYINYKAQIKTNATMGKTLYETTTVTSKSRTAHKSEAKIYIGYGENYKPTPLLEIEKKVANLGKNPGNASIDTSWKKSTTAEPGDTVAFYVFVHNRGEGFQESERNYCSAKDVRVRDVLPKKGKVLTDTAKVTSMNVSMLTDQATVQTTSEAWFEYIPGSTKLFYKDPSGAETWRPLPDGVTTGRGVYVGDIYPCWDKAVYVYFQLKLKGEKKPGKPKIEKVKRAYNVTQKKDAEETVAKTGEIIEYSLITKNTGKGIAKNYVISDDLSDVLDNGEIVFADSGAIRQGNNLFWPALDINPGQEIIKKFKIKIKDQKAGSDCLMANDYGTHINITILCKSKIILKKSAFNITQNKNATSVVANEGDIIEYILIAKNEGNKTKTGFVVSDDLSDVLDNGEIITLNDGAVTSNKIIYPAVDIAPAQEIVKKFKVKVKKQNADNSDCKMVNVYGNKIVIKIFCPIIIKKAKLEVEKYVRNLTLSESAFVKENFGRSGDELEYKIIVKNTGNAPLRQAKLYDILPTLVSKLDYPAGIFDTGHTVGSLAPGEEKEFAITAVIANNMAEGSVLENCALVKGDGLSDRDCVSTKIKVEVKPKPPLVKEIKELPKTGAALCLTLSFAIFAGSFWLYLREKKKAALR